MNHLLAVTLILALLASCGDGSSGPVRAGKKNTIRSEVLEAAHQQLSAFNKADVHGINSFYLQSPEFTAVSYNGTIMDYGKKTADNKAFFSSVSHASYTVTSESLAILENDLALYTAQIRVNADIISGEKMIFERLTISQLWKKTGDQWKIACYQESSMEPDIRLE